MPFKITKIIDFTDKSKNFITELRYHDNFLSEIVFFRLFYLQINYFYNPKDFLVIFKVFSPTV